MVRTFSLLLLVIISLSVTVQAQSTTTVFVPLVQNPPPTVAGCLGGAQNDTLVAVSITSTGELVLAGNLPSLVGVPEVVLPGGGAGVFIQIGADGRSINRVIRIAAILNHAAFGGDGSAVGCGPNGVVVLEADLTTVRWAATPGEVVRCAIDLDGRVAALLTTQTVLIYQANGGSPLKIHVGGTAVRDIAIAAHIV